MCIRQILPANPQLLPASQAIRSELKDREHLVVSTLDQARTFLADQPIEGPGEPRKNLQPKTGKLQPVFYIFILFLSWVRSPVRSQQQTILKGSLLCRFQSQIHQEGHLASRPSKMQQSADCVDP